MPLPANRHRRGRYCDRFGFAVQDDAATVLNAEAKKNLTEAEMEEILVAESARAHSYYFRKQVQETW